MSWAIVLLLGLLAATPAGAVEPAPEIASGRLPSFFIETIIIEDSIRFSPDLILAESRLVEGQEYSERELRDALFRIVRLPLILDAEFSLRRGTQRGRFQLVIQVDEARHWFFGLEGSATRWSRPVTLSGISAENVVQSFSILAGRRFSIGRYGVFFAAAGGQDGSLNLGYSHNNLLGRRILLQISGAYSRCGQAQVSLPLGDEGDQACRAEIFDLGLDPTLSAWEAGEGTARARLTLGVPLKGNQSIRFAGSFLDTEGGFRRAVYQEDPAQLDFLRDRTDWELAASWMFDSRDDPLFTSEGQRWEAGLQVRSLKAEVERWDFENFTSFKTDHASLEVGARLAGSKYWPLGRKDAIWGRLDAFLGRTDFSGVLTEDDRILEGQADVWRGGAAFGYGRFLHRVRTDEKWQELRWESEIEALYSTTSPSFDLPENPLAGFRVSSGLTWRSSWGVFGLELIYQDLGGD